MRNLIPFLLRPLAKTLPTRTVPCASIVLSAVGRIGVLLVSVASLPVLAQTPAFQITQVASALSSSVASGSGIVVVKWSGGTAPFQVQCRTNLGAPWQDVDGTTYGSSQTNILKQPAAFYRVA